MAGRSVIYHWGIDTANFRFDAYGETAEACARAMRAGWELHKRQTGATDRWADVASNAPHAVGLGDVYRDGMLLRKADRRG